jgi:hypothetical protein
MMGGLIDWSKGWFEIGLNLFWISDALLPDTLAMVELNKKVIIRNVRNKILFFLLLKFNEFRGFKRDKLLFDIMEVRSFSYFSRNSNDFIPIIKKILNQERIIIPFFDENIEVLKIKD